MWVDGSRRVFDATDEQQAARPKLTVRSFVDETGETRYALDVQVANLDELATVNVTIDGSAPDADTVEDEDGATRAVQAVKVRLGAAGRDDGLVDERNPMPIVDRILGDLLVEALGELKVIRILLEGIVR